MRIWNFYHTRNLIMRVLTTNQLKRTKAHRWSKSILTFHRCR